MQQQNIPIGTLVDTYKHGEMRLPEIQRHYPWRATRVRDLLDSFNRQLRRAELANRMNAFISERAGL
jgi:hypothetical protein